MVVGFTTTCATNNKDLPLEDALQPGIHSLQFSKQPNHFFQV
jgi:hypothetical protein